MTKPTNRKKWIRQFGKSIVDFGAGHLTETSILSSIGVRVAAFEPYRLGEGNKIDKSQSVELTRKFLEEIRTGVAFDSIFISSVLNSVPFAEDRRQIACICAALSGPRTVLYAWADTIKQSGWTHYQGKDYLSQTAQNELKFVLGYEPGITLGDFQDKPKVQKYHTLAEFRALFAEHFREVNARRIDTCVGAACRGPRIDAAKLRKALEFEFDLPYPDGTTMGLVEEAKGAFGARLGMEL